MYSPWYLSGDVLFMVHIHPSGFCFSTVGIWIKTTQKAGAARWHGITTWTSFLPLSNTTALKLPENEKYFAYETGADLQLQYDWQLAIPTKNKIGGGSSMIVIYTTTLKMRCRTKYQQFSMTSFPQSETQTHQWCAWRMWSACRRPYYKKLWIYVYLMEHSGFTYTIWTKLCVDCLSM